MLENAEGNGSQALKISDFMLKFSDEELAHEDCLYCTTDRITLFVKAREEFLTLAGFSAKRAPMV
jgi:hypothetical protein